MSPVQIGTAHEGLALAPLPSGDLRATLTLPDLTATAPVERHYAHGWADLAAFVEGLADDWRGWPGARSWQSVDAALTLGATHSGSNVTLHVTLRSLTADWTAVGELTLHAGEDLTRAAKDVRALASGR